MTQVNPRSPQYLEARDERPTPPVGGTCVKWIPPYSDCAHGCMSARRGNAGTGLRATEVQYSRACGRNRLVTGVRGVCVSCAERLGARALLPSVPSVVGTRPTLRRNRRTPSPRRGQECPRSRRTDALFPLCGLRSRGRSRPQPCTTFSSEPRPSRIPRHQPVVYGVVRRVENGYRFFCVQ